MEKIQIKINNRDYSLITDEAPERIEQLAASLEVKISEFRNQMRNRPEIEVLTLTAFDLLECIDTEKMNYVKRLGDLKSQIEEMEAKNKQLLYENMSSAESELVQIANVKEQENYDLRSKLLEYEKVWDEHAHGTYKSAASEVEEYADAKTEENEILRETLANFEKSFDDYVQTKEKEIIRLQRENEELCSENEELKQRLAALADDGQLSIC
ncbi:MAG: cell division protein ZapA [Oscillospiraceae bacterium]|nr:cell division protein ZapA [Oscillospiraceae bacterium]